MSSRDEGGGEDSPSATWRVRSAVDCSAPSRPLEARAISTTSSPPSIVSWSRSKRVGSRRGRAPPKRTLSARSPSRAVSGDKSSLPSQGQGGTQTTLPTTKRYFCASGTTHHLSPSPIDAKQVAKSASRTSLRISTSAAPFSSCPSPHPSTSTGNHVEPLHLGPLQVLRARLVAPGPFSAL